MALLRVSGSPGGGLVEREDSRCSQTCSVPKGSRTFRHRFIVRTSPESGRRIGPGPPAPSLLDLPVSLPSRSWSSQLWASACPVTQRSDPIGKLRGTRRQLVCALPCVSLRVPSCVTVGLPPQKAHFGGKPRLFHELTLSSPCFSVDNSEYMRNGDFLPTRLQAQQDAVNIVCHSKTRSNPENNVGLITLANNCEVLTTLTPDTGRILSKLHTVQPKGKITFCTGIRVAHLALKHRQGKNHKMRIIAFVGSPVEDNEKDLENLAPCWIPGGGSQSTAGARAAAWPAQGAVARPDVESFVLLQARNSAHATQSCRSRAAFPFAFSGGLRAIQRLPC
ncbi:26S proteasome non-ATPase regulatory subunit 4 [Athene cunicularia]|uniref:26S proteasome non-ATPase regulatory subunit 4 n=1 Tax=Athene cunicularia TaxID=194338 RepID=UPI000EF6EF81|nr:26S proteasome non-ATPase regulatory subunit 4 [Athene cunicularia]